MLREALEPRLYQHLILGDARTSCHTDLLHRTLIERLELATHIRTYRGPLLPNDLLFRPNTRTWGDWFYQPKRDTPLQESEISKQTIAIISRAINICDLEFSDYTNWESDPVWEPVRTAVSKMQLTRLVCGGRGSAPPLAELLRSQPSLEALDIGWRILDCTQLEDTDLPKLRFLRAPFPEAADIVPGRPIEELHILFGRGETHILESVFHRLSLSTRTTTKLFLHFESRWEDQKLGNLLQAISRSLLGVKELKVMFGGAVSAKVVRCSLHF